MTQADGVSQHNIAVFGMLIGHNGLSKTFPNTWRLENLENKQTNKQFKKSSLKLKYSDSFLCRIPERTKKYR